MEYFAACTSAKAADDTQQLYAHQLTFSKRRQRLVRSAAIQFDGTRSAAKWPTALSMPTAASDVRMVPLAISPWRSVVLYPAAR